MHHVNLGIPVDGLAAETDFLVDVLGLRHLDAPPPANWFEGDDGVQVHLSPDPDHHAPARAHVALNVGAAIGSIARTLDTLGLSYRLSSEDVAPQRLVVRDPADNMWELRSD